MAGQVPAEKADFVIDKTLPNGIFLLRKTTDISNSGERFLGCLLPPERTKITQLEQRGAGKSLLNLLNHENLVNLQTTFVSQPVNGTGLSPPQSLIIWDYCDAGSLADIFADPPDTQESDGDGFLPEGLVWHVALGILRALQWLHEGVRDSYTVKGPTFPDTSSKKASYRTRCEKVRGVTSREVDWWPILHRDIRPENILFQRPRGVETYGLVKLGNFGKAHVSGIVNMGRSPVVAMDSPENDVDIATLRERVQAWRADPDFVPVVERPYTPGSEIFALGAILFRMMTGQVLPPPDKCTECNGCEHISFQRQVEGQQVEGEGEAQQQQRRQRQRPPPQPAASQPYPHGCTHPTVNIFSSLNSLKNYTHGLKQMVVDMLHANRSMNKLLTGRMLAGHWGHYLWWCENTPDGKRHRDLFDDLWAREVHQGWGVVERVRKEIGEEGWEQAGEKAKKREKRDRRGAKRKAATASREEGEEAEGEEEECSEEEEEWDGSTVRVTGRGLEIIYFESESELEEDAEEGQ